jgi:hypothetical protein
VTNSTPASTETERKRIGEAGGTVTRFHLRQGRTTDELIKLGDELEVGLLGSHSEGIIHHAHRPVLVVQEEQTPTDSQTTEEVAATRGESTRRRASDG